MVISVKLKTVYKWLTCGQRENMKYQNSLLAGCDAPTGKFPHGLAFFNQHHILQVLSLLLVMIMSPL